MGQIHYRPLADRNEIRLIELLTGKDHPCHAAGPVHCKIRHVSLDASFLTPECKGATIGSDGSWPSPVIADIESQPEIRDGADSNVLWKRNFTDRVFAEIHSSIGRRSQSSKHYTSSEPKTDNDRDHDPEARLLWRYVWGDFVALSYVWGDSSPKSEIYVDNVPVLVTANLEAALRQLRNHSRIRQRFMIWIDALCINQADLAERAVQVARMRTIYASALHVVVWLGPEEKNSDLAMIAMRFLSLRSREQEPLFGLCRRVERYVIRIPCFQWKHHHMNIRIRKSVLRAIYHVLARPYWRRLWIIQEIASATRRSPILCGDRCILLEDIHNALQVIQGDGATLGRYVIHFAKGGGMSKRMRNSTKGDNYTVSEKLWERPNAIIEAQAEQEELTKETTSDDVFKALLLSSEANTTDERDRVYGILGLPCLSGIVDILADYTLSPTQTFTIFSKSLLLSGNLNGLRLVSSAVPPIGTRYLQSTHFSRPRAPRLIHHHRVVNRGCTHALPSWVICWSCPRSSALALPSSVSAFTAKQPPPASIHDNLLKVQGVLFDTISTLSAFHATESNQTYPQNGPCRTSIYGSHSATKEAFWRTLVADTDRAGAPAPAEYSTMLHPEIWDVGIPGTDGKLRGLMDFYHRNKSLMIFDRPLQQLIRGPRRTMGQHVREQLNTTGRLLRATPIQYEATLRAVRVLAWRRVVTTDSGYLGLAPAGARSRDVIALLAGCDVPLVLRPLEGDGCRFSVIGEGYVHGIMSGRLREFLRQGERQVVDITIC